jgi:uncharacterized repeat protein (TIGR01451 family)
LTGGYNGTIYTGYGNPLAGNSAWSGNSGGWITTTVVLPAAAAGQNVQFRWGCATDLGNEPGVTGWYVDTISLQDAYYVCCGDSASVSVTQIAAPSQFLLGQEGSYVLTITNAGPDLAADVEVTDTLPSEVTFVSASAGGVYSNGVIVWPVVTMPASSSSTVTFTVLADVSGFITNTAAVSTVTPAANSGSNPTINVTTVKVGPNISTQPSNVVALAGTNVVFQVGATGPGPLSYQWFFDSTNLVQNATNTQLTLSNVQPAQAGSYTVVVGNLASSITSAPVVLRVVVPPVIVAGGAAVMSGSGLSLSVNSIAGLNYTLEFKNFLTDPSWTILPASAMTGTGGVITLQDTNAPQTQRFYQVMAH